ncbi:hypothetical protein MBAV_005529 [Candidatus Magnetobacterium bavaricum]|uniref:Uncharacterized protein n=1 Tax=Candidatus Magnetobacterium bavaricum TaxID=29290 RepID=A0A0F3GK21_9BACT|nr:hypothetical protein MBAV_005529 [Candidatus Magnetobacterium bavaricum]
MAKANKPKYTPDTYTAKVAKHRELKASRTARTADMKRSLDKVAKIFKKSIKKDMKTGNTFSRKLKSPAGKMAMRGLGTAGAVVAGGMLAKGLYDKYATKKHGGQSSSGGSGGGDVVVQGYTKDDGTVVKGYTRSRPS